MAEGRPTTDRELQLEINEVLDVELDKVDPESWARTVNILVLGLQDDEDDEDAEGAPEWVYLGEIELVLFDPYFCAAGGGNAGEMIDGHSQEAVDVFYTIYKDDLTAAVFGSGSLELLLRPEVAELLGDFAPASLSLAYFSKMDLAKLTEDEATIVLGRIFDMYVDHYTLAVLCWNAKADKIPLAVLKRIFSKLDVPNPRLRGTMFVAQGGMKLPHHR